MLLWKREALLVKKEVYWTHWKVLGVAIVYTFLSITVSHSLMTESKSSLSSEMCCSYLLSDKEKLEFLLLPNVDHCTRDPFHRFCDKGRPIRLLCVGQTWCNYLKKKKNHHEIIWCEKMRCKRFWFCTLRIYCTEISLCINIKIQSIYRYFNREFTCTEY